MIGGEVLPKFRHPPVNEVAIGVQFSAPQFNPVHFGAYYKLIRNEFPSVQVHPPLAPIFEPVGPGGNFPMPYQFFPGAPIGVGVTAQTRLWFISPSDDMLIQLQSDRLVFNWRKKSSAYPHFDDVRGGFLKAYAALERMMDDEKIGPISPNQCEVLYINPLPESLTGFNRSEPHEIFRLWSNKTGSDWPDQTEDLSFVARYPLRDAHGKPVGRLLASLNTAPDDVGTQVYRLDLTARGAPLNGQLQGIIEFQDIAHRAIVKCFAGITTDAMHQRWERIIHA